MIDPMLWRPDQHEALAAAPWDEAAARQATAEIVADAVATVVDGRWPGHPLDDLPASPGPSTFYLGSAGMLWALARLQSTLDLPGLADWLLEDYPGPADVAEGVHPPSLWMGETGLQLVGLQVGARTADPGRLEHLIRSNRQHPSWELMWGSPGTILAARSAGLDGAARDSAELLWAHRDGDGLWTQTLYGRAARVLGPAHGFAGDVRALRGFVPDASLRELVSSVLDRSALRAEAGRLINWSPAYDPAPQDAIRVQWCHGAPGLVATVGDLMPIELARGGAELTWRAGPLRKGPNLCHGTAGNGYAFLRVFALTGDELWLTRARQFAMHAIGQVNRTREQFGRGRYSLWTGDLGVALYLRSCLTADPAFPSIDDL
jgi:hypothetical protein